MVKLLVPAFLLVTLIGISSCWVIRHTYQVESIPGPHLPPHKPIVRGRKMFISRRKFQADPRGMKSPNTGFRTMLNVPNSARSSVRAPKPLAVRNPVPKKASSVRRISSPTRGKKLGPASALPVIKRNKLTKKIMATRLTKEEIANIRAEAMDLDIFEKPRTAIITKSRVGRYPIYFYRRY